MATISRKRPSGISILGALYILGGIFSLIAGVAIGAVAGSLGGIPLFGPIAGVIGGALAAFFIILAIVEFVIAGALLSGKSWGRKLIMVLAGIDLIIEVVSLVAGNAFAVVGIIIDLIVLYYMTRQHVKEYFEGHSASFRDNIQSSKPEPSSTTCPLCGNILSSQSNFCNKCGAKLKACGMCGVMNSGEAAFCGKCGQKFSQ